MAWLPEGMVHGGTGTLYTVLVSTLSFCLQCRGGLWSLHAVGCGFPTEGQGPVVSERLSTGPRAFSSHSVLSEPSAFRYLLGSSHASWKEKLRKVATAPHLQGKGTSKVLTGFETNNKFEIKNSLGQMVYVAVEDTDCCTRNCCEAARPFTMRILDNLGREVMTLERPLRCSSCCFPCCLQEIEIQAPPGVPIGYVIQTWHPCLPKLTLQNERKEDVLKIVGPCVACTCCSDIDFEIKSLDEVSRIGKITKQWSGCMKEAFTDSDNFGIQFPLDLDVKMKAVSLGACFLLDYMFFEGCE